MRIHEFQSKALLKNYGIPVPRGVAVSTPEEARSAAREIGGAVVLKAQIHAGGRGKGGGIRTAASPEEAESLARSMIGLRLVTPQTGPGGRLVKRLLVEEAVDISREFYVGIAIDRKRESLALILSSAGGVEVEETSKRRPERIIKIDVDPKSGLESDGAAALAKRIGLDGVSAPALENILSRLLRLFIDTDASLIEINPLVQTHGGFLLALDAKIIFDDNGLARHPELRSWRDPNEESPLEWDASKNGLNYIKLDGSTGCLVNGAGLAMATMDLIMLAGGKPANFLDVGGGGSEESVKNAIRILTSDPDVRAALINIFGGIVRCDMVANGIVRASRELDIRIPLVVRFQGTNAAEGRKILQESGLAFETAETMQEAADKAVRRSLGIPGGLR